ncbi:hypothetical protein Sj15T_05830 [Sphingobium sp. TA15]|uniref:Uncharacterized protein n=1 Tax=Sphingobium indicum (strain DSM 16413 / CCM 7287 / MTCC 6362 / UT26 / NBRC 101211 / UT26S) TaxID=452662 RepID=D4Z0Y1_SPHIU|nr:hypothetical protein [Sphingobium indicum]BAI96263.1 hypothetical protein SJA_C1-14290 [Sphingobium indicum UT26S]BDD65562.1 hypothetical protein Sj15T_05830 [Sphingobium sp. TA15]
MPKRALSLLSAVLALSAPAFARAAEEQEAWTTTITDLRADAAGIGMPQSVAGLSLSKSGEVSHGGKGIDNYAQYLSDDGAIQATLYVYLPSYADASLAAYMTDKAVTERFGARTRRTAYASVAVAGHADGAIRAVYDDAADGALTTAAAFLHVGRWLVKLRVTGPTERRKEVLAGLDGMLAGLRFDDSSSIHATKPARLTACPAADAGEARLTQRSAAAPVDVALPREGQEALCIRGKVDTADGSRDILQQAGIADGAIIVPVDDAGTVMAFDPAEAGRGYRLSIHSVGQTDLYGVYDKVPSARQMAQILDGKDPQTAQAGATAAYTANGQMTVRTADAKLR